MERRVLGRTGMKVTVMGVGCGGPSRVGQKTGKSEAESVALIREAVGLGVNFFDTAAGYKTEAILGNAIRAFPRDSLVISTKATVKPRPTQEGVRNSLTESLRRLQTDYVDIYHLHGVLPGDYEYLASEFAPLLEKLRDEGKIRFIGLTEDFSLDTGHAMLQRALQDEIWDVVMVGFNILNQSARDRVLRTTLQRNIGVLNMQAVRIALSRPPRLIETVAELLRRGQLDATEIDKEDPLGFLIHPGGALNMTDAAYRFARDEPGTHVILSGTGNPAHLRANFESFARPPLPPEDTERLRHIFRKVDSVSGQADMF